MKNFKRYIELVNFKIYKLEGVNCKTKKKSFNNIRF